MTVTRIGFAYNPTIEAAVELSARAAGWSGRALRLIEECPCKAGCPSSQASTARVQ